MANIQILDLELVQTEFSELSHMELESIIGGRAIGDGTTVVVSGGTTVVVSGGTTVVVIK
ncbi:hypothetical protein [Nodularia spumigena]|uniref:Uncharacterized protein n=1 Tax=Nodularia spumigena UHCC 0039 TaxID=1914872 RepID=A0A2S0Q5B1_NODSP|nr:hypothetical protein [Nodularia spumigena]AVZ29573.1 hypothetical protein BMF81_00285 [Nodularia spumigena UHCC 0039]